METTFEKQFELEKKKFLVDANFGISLPAAGALYWLALGIAGFYLDPHTWSVFGFFGSGLIFPIGLMLSKPLKANLNAKSPFSSLAMPAVASMFLSWPLIIAGFMTDPMLVPLFLAIGMSLHWPAIGWMYGSEVCMFHALVRVILVSILWYFLPEMRFTVIPLVVSGIYVVTIFGMRREINAAKLILGKP